MQREKISIPIEAWPLLTASETGVGPRWDFCLHGEGLFHHHLGVISRDCPDFTLRVTGVTWAPQVVKVLP